MKKVLACCEYCIVSDTSARYNEALRYFQPESMVRIVEGLRQRAYHNKTLVPEIFFLDLF